MNLLEEIEKSYSERCGNSKAQIALWKKVSASYDPHENIQTALRPSLAIARESGDLGVSLLWIVQFSLIRHLIADLLTEMDADTDLHNTLIGLDPTALGALAHSDDASNPMMISPGKKGLTLTGTKKYITGGMTAEFLLLTGREQNDDKITSIIYLPSDKIPSMCLEEIQLNSLLTTSHGRLTLNNFIIDSSHMVPVAPSSIRKTIKRWGIIERSLITEALLGLLSYLNETIYRHIGKHLISENRMSDLIASQGKTCDNQIRCALDKMYIDEKKPDFAAIGSLILAIKNIDQPLMEILPDVVRLRLRDLDFLNSIRL